MPSTFFPCCHNPQATAMLHMVLVTNLLEVKGRGPYLAFCSHALSLHLQALPSPDSLPSSAGAFSTSSTCSSSSS